MLSFVASISCISTPRQQSSIKMVRYPADSESNAVAPNEHKRRVSLIFLYCHKLACCLHHANTYQRKHHTQDRTRKCRLCLSVSIVYTTRCLIVFCCPRKRNTNRLRDLFPCKLLLLPQQSVRSSMRMRKRGKEH